MRAIVLVIAALALLVCPGPVDAELVNLGVLSFDTFIPGAPQAPGVNAFNIGNLTGDPLTGGFALAPDFPVSTLLVFTDSRLTVVSGTSTEVLFLGDIAAGFLSLDALLFSETVQFDSASFSATLNQTNFVLTDGVSFVVDSSIISVPLTPSSGSVLVANTDFALINVSGERVVVPEPSQEPLVYTLLLLPLLWYGRKSGFHNRDHPWRKPTRRASSETANLE